MAILPFLLALVFWSIHPNITIDADSPRYLGNDPLRTATYPLFLDLIPQDALLPAQLFLLAAALSWLAIYCSRFLNWIVSAAMVLLVAGNPYVWALQASIMSEALTFPLLVLLVASVLGVLSGLDRKSITVAALLTGIATTVRPSMAPLVLVPLSAVWIVRSNPMRLQLSLVTLAVWATPIILERLYSTVVHGSALTSPIGRTLFMKAAVLDAPPTVLASNDVLDRRLLHIVNSDFAPARDTINAAPDREVRYILLSNYEACAWVACIRSVVESRPEAEVHPHMLRVAFARLSSNKLGTLVLVATEYHRLWLLHPRKTPDLAAKYNTFLAQAAPLPFQPELGEEGKPTQSGEQNHLYRLTRAAFASMGIVAGLMTLVFAFWRPNRLLGASFALLLGTQAVLVLSSVFGLGLPRYTMGVWPTMISAELLGLAGLLAVWKPNVVRV